MVLLFANRKSKTEKEIIEILKSFGGNYISDKSVHTINGLFTIISEYKPAELNLNRGIAIFCDETERFKKQILPKGFIGICQEHNSFALEVFKSNKVPVIICGMNPINTITLSSLTKDFYVISLQRTITDNKGNEIMPCEYKIKLKKQYSPLSVMFSVAILLLNGFYPKEF